MADINYTGTVYTSDSGGQNFGWSQVGAAQTEPVPNQLGPNQLGQEPSSLGAMSSVVGAMVSLALVVGIGVWGYKLMIRDVSGVPVVRSIEGPMRVQPDSPGGQQADHQGLAVNAVAAAGTAAPTADRLMLAPRPVQLTEEDVPRSQAGAQQDETVQTDTAPTGDDALATAVEALVEQLTAGVEPLTGEESPIVSRQEAAKPEILVEEESPIAAPEAQPAVLTGPGLTRSLRPQSRPARAIASDGDQGADPVLTSAINAAVDAVARLEVDPASLPSGTRLAQLGAYDSAEIARAEWDKLNIRFEEYLEGKQRVIQKASSGGRTFYRLRAMGFDDLSDARRFCSALVSENTDCIPVTAR